ncbi:MAG: sigma factor-like helix-turn-helix DNA-binding protein [Planctomycetota bacterium]
MASLDATRLRAFVQNLDQTDRYIVLLHYADGLTEMEIAAVLNLTAIRVHGRLEELREVMHGFIARPIAARQTQAQAPLPNDDTDPRPAAYA